MNNYLVLFLVSCSFRSCIDYPLLKCCGTAINSYGMTIELNNGQKFRKIRIDMTALMVITLQKGMEN